MISRSSNLFFGYSSKVLMFIVQSRNCLIWIKSFFSQSHSNHYVKRIQFDPKLWQTFVLYNLMLYFLQQREQLLEHEQQIQQREQELHDHQLYPPEKGAKSRVIADYMEKEHYLQFEVGHMKFSWYFTLDSLFSPWWHINRSRVYKHDICYFHYIYRVNILKYTEYIINLSNYTLKLPLRKQRAVFDKPLQMQRINDYLKYFCVVKK